MLINTRVGEVFESPGRVVIFRQLAPTINNKLPSQSSPYLSHVVAFLAASKTAVIASLAQYALLTYVSLN